MNEERSITAEILFRDVTGWIVKSAGTKKNAVQIITPELLNWAYKIIVMENTHYEKIIELAPDTFSKILVLGIKDEHYFFSPELVGRIIIELSKRFQLDGWVKTKFQCS